MTEDRPPPPPRVLFCERWPKLYSLALTTRRQTTDEVKRLVQGEWGCVTGGCRAIGPAPTLQDVVNLARAWHMQHEMAAGVPHEPFHDKGIVPFLDVIERHIQNVMSGIRPLVLPPIVFDHLISTN